MDSIIRGANWYVNEINQRLRTEMAQLPKLSRDLMPVVLGGGWFGLELPGEIKPLTAEFDVNGVHKDLKTRFGREPGDWTTVTYYESLLNVFPAASNGTVNAETKPKLTGRVVFLKGLINDYEQPGMKGMKPSGATKLVMSSIVLYHDIMNGETVHKFDVQNNDLIIDGVNYTAEYNTIIAA